MCKKTDKPKKQEVTTASMMRAMKAYLKATGQDRRPPDPRVLERINTI